MGNIYANDVLTPCYDFNGTLSTVLLCNDGQEFLVEELENGRSYNIYDASLTKKWNVTANNNNETINTINIHTENNIRFVDSSIRFTQSLINNDDELEYVIVKFSDLSNPTTAYGIKIMQTNGNCIANIDFGYSGSFEGCTFVQVGENLLWEIVLYVSEDNGPSTMNMFIKSTAQQTKGTLCN